MSAAADRPPSAAPWTILRRHIIEAVPPLVRDRDTVLPAIIICSLIVHASVLVGLYLSQAKDASPRHQEIPVEIVQLPPPMAKAPEHKPQPQSQQQKPVDAKPPPKPQQQAATDPPKPKPQPQPQPQPQPKPAARPQPPAESVADRMKDLLGPIPPGLAALAMPGEAQAGTDTVSYSQIVMSHIAKAKKQGRYPGVPGYATVEFVLGDGGEVTKLDLRRPSGIASLDAEALDMVKRGAPYPAPPPGGRRDYVVTLQFRALP